MGERQKVWNYFEDRGVILKWNVRVELPSPSRVPRCTETSGLLSVLSGSLPVRGRYAGKVRLLAI
jgi:hypothetical protein